MIKNEKNRDMIGNVHAGGCVATMDKVDGAAHVGQRRRFLFDLWWLDHVNVILIVLDAPDISEYLIRHRDKEGMIKARVSAFDKRETAQNTAGIIF